MRVEVRAFATLRAFLPPGSRHATVLAVPEGSTIRDVARALGIADEMALVALLNGREAEPGQPVTSDDVVTLFPPLVGWLTRRLALEAGWYTRMAAGSV